MARNQSQQPRPQRLRFGNAPRCGERILILKPRWLRQILNGTKTLEIRALNLRAGDVWLGCNKQVVAKALLGTGFPIRTKKMWRDLRSKHGVPDNALPYKKTFALPVQVTQRFADPIAYSHRRGAIGIVRFC